MIDKNNDKIRPGFIRNHNHNHNRRNPAARSP